MLPAVLLSAACSSSRMSRASSSCAADDAKPDVVAEQRVQLEPQVALEQRHQRRDFHRRALPVLDRERVERQDLDAETRRPLDDVAHRIDAGAVALDARQVPLRRPAAVAVHDHGDMPRQTVEVDLTSERLFRGAGRSGRTGIRRAPSSSGASKPRYTESYGGVQGSRPILCIIKHRREFKSSDSSTPTRKSPAAGAARPARARSRAARISVTFSRASGPARRRRASRRSCAPCGAEIRHRYTNHQRGLTLV